MKAVLLTLWLQTKEKLISSLQTGSDGVPGPAQEAALEQLQLEKEAIEMELETARLQGARLREELQETEDQHNQEMEQLAEQVRNSQGLAVHVHVGRYMTVYSCCVTLGA